MFGGGGGRESRPQYVQNEWSLATEFIKDYIGAVCCVGVPTYTSRCPTTPLGLGHQGALIRSQRGLVHAGRLQAHRFDSGLCGRHPNSHARYALLCSHPPRARWQAATALHQLPHQGQLQLALPAVKITPVMCPHICTGGCFKADVR